MEGKKSFKDGKAAGKDEVTLEIRKKWSKLVIECLWKINNRTPKSIVVAKNWQGTVTILM